MHQDRERLLAAGIVALAVLLGLQLRLLRVAGADFPLNDGALFVQMTEDLRAARYWLPAWTTYNQAGIPFAYPPLAFYVAGWLADLGVPLLDVVRLGPALVSTCTILAFHLLARALLGSRLVAATATLAFALLPRTFVWFVMGGGLTRAPGLLFALLALHATVRMVHGGGWRFAALAAVFGAATLGTHAENAWFAAYSAVLIVLVGARDRRVLMQALAAGAGAAVLSAAWWAAVLAEHGLAPFRAVSQSASYADFFSWQPIFRFSFTDEPQMRPLAFLGLVGVVVALLERRWLLPLWLVTVFAINPRNGATSAMVPLALLVAVAVRRVLVLSLLVPGDQPPARHARLGVAVLLSVLTGYAFMNARWAVQSVPGLRVLPAEARSAMAFASTHTPAGARFLVIDGEAPWFGLDPMSEWFPVIARRTSVATVQGLEWKPGQVFRQRMRASDDLLPCRHEDATCLDRWAARWQQPFTYLFIARQGCSERFLASLAAAGWRTVRDQDGYTILERL